MRILKLCICLLIGQIFVNNLIALERESSCSAYCINHNAMLKNIDLSNYAILIPLIGEKCAYIDCSTCHNVREQYYYHESDGDEYSWEEAFYNCDCKEPLLESNYRYYWDIWMPTWTRCNNYSIYPSYLQDKKYNSFFYSFLEYCLNNKHCQCYWPEKSEKAAEISDRAYELFKSLFSETALSRLDDVIADQKELFINIPRYGYTIHGMVVIFILIMICQK